MNAITVVVLAVALALSPAAAAQRTELGGKVRSGRTVTIPATETVQGDLVATGGTVRIDGRVEGDLVASAGQVIVAGTVTGDVLAGAGSTTISGLLLFGGLLVAAIVVFLFVLVVAFAARATVGLALGRLLIGDQDRSFLGGLGALAVGVLVVVGVAAIPLVGGRLEVLMVLLGLGALLLMARPSRRPIAQPVS